MQVSDAEEYSLLYSDVDGTSYTVPLAPWPYPKEAPTEEDASPKDAAPKPLEWLPPDPHRETAKPSGAAEGKGAGS